MLDTQMAESLTSDAGRGPYPRLTPAAVERAKDRLGINDLATLGAALGFSRQTFWRARGGDHDISYSHAKRIAKRLGMPLDEVFEGGRDA
jgi:hypothetical protein